MTSWPAAGRAGGLAEAVVEGKGGKEEEWGGGGKRIHLPRFNLHHRRVRHPPGLGRNAP